MLSRHSKTTKKDKVPNLKLLSPVEPKPYYKGDTIQHLHFCACHDQKQITTSLFTHQKTK